MTRALRRLLPFALLATVTGCSHGPAAPAAPAEQSPAAGAVQNGAASKKRILVVLSGSNRLTLRDGGVHPTGFYLNELVVPLERLLAAGYEPVFATPRGKEAVLDPGSDSSRNFGGDDTKRLAAHQLLERLAAFHRPLSFHDVLRDGIGVYSGVFVPGGHAPLEDLATDRELGSILRAFHESRRPTALICHGPIALVSALKDPDGFVRALSRRGGRGLRKLSKGWLYAGYRMTIFSSAEERVAEDRMLGGRVRYYPDRALESAGGRIETAAKGESHVVVDRELVTGQNPASDHALAEAFLKVLGAPDGESRP